jgi:hypothetical protein
MLFVTGFRRHCFLGKDFRQREQQAEVRSLQTIKLQFLKVKFFERLAFQRF